MAQERHPSANPRQQGRPQTLSTKDFQLNLQKFEPQIARVIDPRVFSADRMMGLALNAFMNNPTLQRCTTASLVNSILYAAQLGLEVNTPLGHAYLIPYWQTAKEDKPGGYMCQLQIGYRGLIALAYRSDRVQHIDAHVVSKKDRFHFQYGSNAQLTHEPDITGDVDPESWIAAYMVLHYRNGGVPYFHVMRRSDIEKVMSVSQGAWKKDPKTHKLTNELQGPWKDWPDEMRRKTPTKRGLKYAELSPMVQRAVGLDDLAEAGEKQPAIIDWSDFTREELDEMKKRIPEAEAQPEKPDAPADRPSPKLSMDAVGPLDWDNFTPEEKDRVLRWAKATRKMNAAQTEAALGSWRETKGILFEQIAEFEKTLPKEGAKK